MATTGYDLKFTIAGRTVFSRRLNIIHWDGFRRARLSELPGCLPDLPDGGIEGYLVHSAEVDITAPETHSDEGYLAYIMQEYARHLTRFEGSFDDFLGTMSSKTRSTLRRKVRKFAKEDESSTIDWRTYSTPEAMQEFFEYATPLAERTYQARLFDGALPDSDEFRRQACDDAAAGRLKAYLLFLNGEPVAYLYTPLEQRTYLYAYLGFDEAVAHLSPGTVLQFLVHEHLFEEKSADYFDFTEGEGPHKALFSNQSTRCCNVLYLKKSTGNRLLISCHRIWNQGVEFFSRQAEKINLRNTMKRLARQKSTA